jgi:hypothetical protein
MYVARTVAAVNPYSRAPAKTRSVSAVGNPAWLLTLGPVNPKEKRRNNVAKKHKKASGHHKASRKNKRPRSGNPFATSISLQRPVGIGKAAVGVLAGVALVKGISSVLPVSISGNSLYMTLAEFAIAGGVWWGLSFIDPEFGASAGLGGIAKAGSDALDTWFPSIGQYSPLGDFVPGAFTVPQTPVNVDSVPYAPSRRSIAYGGAYRVAAA